MTALQNLKQSCARSQRTTCFTTVRPKALSVSHKQQQASKSAAADVSRRNLLAGISAAGLLGSSFVQPLPAAAASPLDAIARQITRPEITPLDAAVALLDARATLKDMAPLVSNTAAEQEAALQGEGHCIADSLPGKQAAGY